MSFRDMEMECEQYFKSLGPVYHMCTPEDHEILFTNDEEFSDAIGILAICSKLNPSIRLFTFQLMHNHLHVVAGGEERDVRDFFALFKNRLGKYFEGRGRFVNLKKFDVKLFEIDSLDYFRAAIAYVNRNGFVVFDSVTPFTYPWGANICFFNPIMKKYYNRCRFVPTVAAIRKLFHSKTADQARDLFALDDCISPYSFCDISGAEKAFRSDKQYFYYVAKNVEAFSMIANTIGEMVSYTDEDVYQAAYVISKEQFKVKTISALDHQSKITIAKQLHSDYHANKKQLQRILKIDTAILNALF